MNTPIKQDARLIRKGRLNSVRLKEDRWTHGITCSRTKERKERGSEWNGKSER